MIQASMTQIDEDSLDLGSRPSMLVIVSEWSIIEVPARRSGFLVKKAGEFSGLERFFVLPPWGTLLWYKTEKRMSLLATAISLALRSLITIEPSSQLRADANSRALTLKGSKSYLLTADDSQEAAA